MIFVIQSGNEVEQMAMEGRKGLPIGIDLFEIKRAKGRELLENSCKQAIDQIKSKGYAQSNCCFRKN